MARVGGIGKRLYTMLTWKVSGSAAHTGLFPGVHECLCRRQPASQPATSKQRGGAMEPLTSRGRRLALSTSFSASHVHGRLIGGHQALTAASVNKRLRRRAR